MGDFFKSRRKQLGIATLMLAMVFGFWWVRSLSISDVVLIRSFQRYVTVFASDRSSMLWVRRLDTDPTQPFYSTHAPDDDIMSRMTPQWDVKPPTTIVFIPYAAVVIPLTLISAYLLLRQPPNGTYVVTRGVSEGVQNASKHEELPC